MIKGTDARCSGLIEEYDDTFAVSYKWERLDDEDNLSLIAGQIGDRW